MRGAELDTQIERRCAKMRVSARQPISAKAITSFLEKRKPTWSGKMSQSRNRHAVNETRLRVRYAETDQMGVVYHANHFIWFEVGRVELLRQLGFSYSDMEQRGRMLHRRGGCALPLQGSRALRRRSHRAHTSEKCARIGGSFRIRTVRAEDGTLLAEGETTHIVTDCGR